MTDGNGGFLFLKSIVRNYLALVHPAEMQDVPTPNSASAAALEQDSFRNFYGATKRRARPPNCPMPTTCGQAPAV